MNMQFNLSPALIKKALADALGRYHVTLFTIIVLGSLTFAIFLLNEVILESGNTSGTPVSISSSFDQTTINRIKQLKTPDQSGQLDLPAGRTNPFTE